MGGKVIRRLSNSTASSGDDAAHSRVGVAEERDQSEYASEGEDDGAREGRAWLGARMVKIWRTSPKARVEKRKKW